MLCAELGAHFNGCGCVCVMVHLPNPTLLDEWDCLGRASVCAIVSDP